MGTVDEVRDLLEERPDLEPAVEAVLKPSPPFTFDDIAIDSGPFGELVSHGVVEKTDEGYRVPDPEAVQRALSDDVRTEPNSTLFDLSLPAAPMSRFELGFLAGAIALVVALRLLPVPTVYYDGHVVLSSNDPYYYRYLVEQLLRNPEVSPSTLGFTVSKGEPLLITTLWLVTLIFGGTATVAGHVMAWYPIASAVLTSVLLYVLAVVVTEDRRVGIGAVAMLAVVPAHALRTSFGFADHHAFDFVWLLLTLLGIVVIARQAHRDRSALSSKTVAAVAATALGVAGQTLAWDNSPILLMAIGGYLALEGARTLQADDDPLKAIAPVVVGVALGATITWLVHSSLGWHTTLVASAPALLAGGGIGVLAGAVLFDRVDLSSDGSKIDRAVVGLVFLEVVGLVSSAFVLKASRPAFWNRLMTTLQERLLVGPDTAEAMGLFSQAGGWLLLLGFALFLGVPYLVWASGRVVKDGRWGPPVAYGWYFLVLSIVQARFVGELAPVLALFTGLGLVHLAERIDVARPPNPFTDTEPPDSRLPDRRQFLSLTLLFLLVGSLGIIQVPVKTSQVTVSNAQADAAFWMAEYSDEHDMEYPENYVFSEWGWSRLYNYFVNGQSRSYGYAQGNFQSFVSSTDPTGWFERLGNRRGFVVTTTQAIGEQNQIGTRLHRHNGAGSENTGALAHYRLVHVTGGGAYKVFTVVPGAVIHGTATANETVTASTDVQVQDVSFTYERTTTANPNGQFSIRVAQPGTYQVAGDTVEVNGSAVRNGTVVMVG